MDISFQIAHLDKVLAAFQRAPEHTARRLRLGLEVSLKEIALEAQMVHRFIGRTHDLERSVDYEVISATELHGIVQLREEVAPYGPFIHDGTGLEGPRRKYLDPITPKKGKFLRWPAPGGGGFIYARKVTKNPGVKPDPFLYDAAERKRERVNAIFNRYAGIAIKEAGLA